MHPSGPDSAPVELATCVYLDLETTGLEPEAEVVAIVLLDAQGAPLLDSLVRPQGPTAWPEAQRIHGISPDDVVTAPRWAELATRIHTAVADRQVVLYNADFDCRFLGDLLTGATRIHCCMLAWAHHVGEWSDYWGGYRWHTLVEAAAEVEFDWAAESLEDRPHSAVAMPGPAGRCGITCMIPSCASASRPCRHGAGRRRRMSGRGVSGICGPVPAWRSSLTTGGWSAPALRIGPAATPTRVTNWRCSLRAPPCAAWNCWPPLPPATGARRRSLRISSRAAGFTAAAWYQRELQPTAAFVGRRQAYALYPVSEKERLDVKFRLRLAPVQPAQGALLANRTKLQSLGYSPSQIEALTPVAELYNSVGHFWYPVYQVPGLEPAL